MASLSPALENRQRALKITAHVVSGWKKSGFRGRGSIGYLNNTRLVFLLDVVPPRKLAPSVTFFPTEVQQGRAGDNSLYYQFRYPEIEVFADLEKHMGTLLNSGKPGFVWGPIPMSNLWLKLTVYIQPHHAESKVTWEHDVLPFLPGGQFESKRSHH